MTSKQLYNTQIRKLRDKYGTKISHKGDEIITYQNYDWVLKHRNEHNIRIINNRLTILIDFIQNENPLNISEVKSHIADVRNYKNKPYKQIIVIILNATRGIEFGVGDFIDKYNKCCNKNIVYTTKTIDGRQFKNLMDCIDKFLEYHNLINHKYDIGYNSYMRNKVMSRFWWPDVEPEYKKI